MENISRRTEQHLNRHINNLKQRLFNKIHQLRQLQTLSIRMSPISLNLKVLSMYSKIRQTKKSQENKSLF